MQGRKGRENEDLKKERTSGREGKRHHKRPMNEIEAEARAPALRMRSRKTGDLAGKNRCGPDFARR